MWTPLRSLTPRDWLEASIQLTVALAPPRTSWTLHNLVAHPVGEIHFLLTGDREFQDWFHDITLPPEGQPEPSFETTKDEGRFW